MQARVMPRVEDCQHDQAGGPDDREDDGEYRENFLGSGCVMNETTPMP